MKCPKCGETWPNKLLYAHCCGSWQKLVEEVQEEDDVLHDEALDFLGIPRKPKIVWIVVFDGLYEKMKVFSSIDLAEKHKGNSTTAEIFERIVDG